MTLAQISVEHTKARAWVVFAVGAAGALMLLAMYPVANTLSGQTTVLNVSLAMTVTIAVSVAGLGAGGYGLRQKVRADKAERRGRDLSRDVKELQQRLRENGLSDRVTR